MNLLKHAFVAIATVAAVSIGAMALDSVVSASPATEVSVPTTAAEHVAEAKKYDQEALELDQKAKQHEAMAKAYQVRASGGTKQAEALLSLSEHCKRLASHYADSAVEARATAKSHRDMADAI
jgi:hypothetical protein